MTELEEIKLELFNLVDHVGAIPTQDENTFIFTKEQLRNYSKFLLNEAMDNIKTNIENDLDDSCIDDAVELGLNYDRELSVDIDIRAIHGQIRSIVEDSEYSDLEDPIASALEYAFPVEVTDNETPYVGL